MSYQNPNIRQVQNLSQKPLLSPPDNKLLIIVIFLIVIGIMAIFSTTAQKAIEEGLNPASYVLKQLFFLGIGVFLMNYFVQTDYKKLGKYVIPFAWGVVVLLLLVKYTPLGVVANGAKRWMQLGPIQFQPSELAKIAVIGLLSRAFYKDSKLLSEEKLKYYVPIIVMMLIIFLQPNLSMIMLIGITGAIMYLSCGGSFMLLFKMGLLACAPLPFLLHTYQINRIKTWFNPEVDPQGLGYNVIQSKLAFAVGGIWGVGYGNSKQKLYWLPEAHTDFIFAIIAEEAGFLGCLLVIGLFCGLIHRGLIISSRCPDIFGKLLAAGITTVLGVQAALNMSVASSFLPATGVPLPFISYGGTSLVVNMIMVGILLNISRKRIKRINSIEQAR